MSWTDDRDRCQAAGVPNTMEFSTKPDLAAEMITAEIITAFTRLASLPRPLS